MAEIISRIILALIGTIVVAPIICILATPFILVRPLFTPGPYWKNVGKRYKRLFVSSLNWGYVFLQP